MIGLHISKPEVIKYVGILVAGLALGFFLFGRGGDVPATPNTIPVNGEIALQTSTEVSVQPKEIVNGTLEKTDLEVATKPVDFTVKVNGHTLDIKKEENENYVLDRNKIVVNSELKGTYSLNIEPVYIDKTKRFGIGGGVGMVRGKVEPVAIISFPVDKKRNIDGWAVGNQDIFLAGIIKKF